MEGETERYQVTVRYGAPRHRYHQFTVEAPDIRGALTRASAELPDEVAEDGELVEIRPFVDPDAREYLEG
ncbi:MAG: hypothetical protein WD013_03355 [Gemmatimonadota bacterium]